MKPTKIYAEVLEDEALKQFQDAMALDCVVAGALMPDAHTGYSLPIGAVVAVKDHVSPAFVGYDIGCGMCAAKLDLDASSIDKQFIFDAIYANIPVGRNQHLKPQQVPSIELYNVSSVVTDHLSRKGSYQLGTLGGGNHFIELGEGQDGKLWIVIHSGSRNIGHAVAEHYMELAARQSLDFTKEDAEFTEANLIFKERNPEGFAKALEAHHAKTKLDLEGQYLFHIDTPEAQAYINDMKYCLDYALANREHMINRIMNLLGDPGLLEFINKNHNHAELVDGLWIHRKGATQASEGMLGVIPGNMRDGSFIVRGKGNPDSLYSSSHGAGRVLSRKQAQKTLSMGQFSDEMCDVVAKVDLDTLDESPMAYKNIFDVMQLQSDLVEVIDHIRPLVNIKG
jgi:tRNA-splicing ligase RtcB (3'-phosphate/5'-hydroxy nucleic acid ligase)